jgi:hypothetical protein
MTISTRSSHHLKLGFLILLLTTLSYYFFSPRYDVPSIYRVAVTGRKGTFTRNILEHEIDGPFDTTALTDLCSTRKWTPGLIFQCEPPEGGAVNIRNIFLNCLRYAIEAGGSSTSKSFLDLTTH